MIYFMIYFRRSSIAKKVGAALGAALLLFLCGSSPSFAFPVTDPFGNTCDTSELVQGPDGLSICPASASLIRSRAINDHMRPYLRPLQNPDVNDMNRAPYYGWMDPGESSNPTVTIGMTPYEILWLPIGMLGGPVTFSLHGSDNSNGDYTGGGVSSTHNSGYSVSDSAGAIAPNSLAPGFNSLTYGMGLNATLDGSRIFGLVGSNQKLIFGLTFN